MTIKFSENDAARISAGVGVYGIVLASLRLNERKKRSSVDLGVQDMRCFEQGTSVNAVRSRARTTDTRGREIASYHKQLKKTWVIWYLTYCRFCDR